MGAVAQANTATFGARAMRLVPDGLLPPFLPKAKDAELAGPTDPYRHAHAFAQHNLMEPLGEQTVRPGVAEKRADLL